MKFDIDERHFTVFNLLLLLLAWANTCFVIFSLFQKWLPLFVNVILLLTGSILTLVMVFITIYVTIRWVRHHDLTGWVVIGIIVLFVISWGLESTVRGLFIREQIFEQQEMY